MCNWIPNGTIALKTNDENMQAQFTDQRADYGKKIAEIKSDMVELKRIAIKNGSRSIRSIP